MRRFLLHVAVQLPPHPALRIARQRGTAAEPGRAREPLGATPPGRPHAPSAWSQPPRCRPRPPPASCALLWIGDARDRDNCSRCDDPRTATPRGDLMTRHRFPRPRAPARQFRTGLIETCCGLAAQSHHTPAARTPPMPPKQPRAPRNTLHLAQHRLHIAYLRGRAALECP